MGVMDRHAGIEDKGSNPLTTDQKENLLKIFNMKKQGKIDESLVGR